MNPVRRLLALLGCVLLVLPLGPAAGAVPPPPGTRVHIDVSVTASGELLTKGPQPAGRWLDGL